MKRVIVVIIIGVSHPDVAWSKQVVFFCILLAGLEWNLHTRMVPTVDDDTKSREE